MASQAHGRIVGLIDDDESVRTALSELLLSVGLRAKMFGSAEEFLDFGQRSNIGCLIADICMPGMSGLELQDKLNVGHSTIPIIFITAHGDEKMRMQALRAGAAAFVAKPFDHQALLEKVRVALES
jgi:FixJ family two-component response regulator